MTECKNALAKDYVCYGYTGRTQRQEVLLKVQQVLMMYPGKYYRSRFGMYSIYELISAVLLCFYIKLQT